jgi:hypothetical protein
VPALRIDHGNTLLCNDFHAVFRVRQMQADVQGLARRGRDVIPSEADEPLPHWLLGFACGVLVGTALGLVFAPAPGRDTRRWITTRTGDIYRSAAPLFHPSELGAIVRQRGVRGLLDALHRESPAPTP